MRRSRSCCGLVAVLWMVSIASGGTTSVPVVVFGSLVITTEPGTDILWDGNLLGTTDETGRMSVSSIPPGAYTLTARKEGFDSVVREIESAGGAETLEIALLARPDPAPEVDATLPDPFARRSTPLISVALVAFLIGIAAGALWLGRRRRMAPEEEIPLQPEGPRVVLAQGPRGRRRPPSFYEDLRKRETELEILEERGPDRPRPKVIELPVADRRPVEGDG